MDWILAVAAAAATAAAVGIGANVVAVRGWAAPPMMASAVVIAFPTRKYWPPDEESKEGFLEQRWYDPVK